MLVGANLSEARLTNTHMARAQLSGATLASTDLSGADLRDADLSGANLTQANLANADLTGTDLRGANLTRAYGLTPANDGAAKLDEAVTCPDGTLATGRTCVRRGGTTSPALGRAAP